MAEQTEDLTQLEGLLDYDAPISEEYIEPSSGFAIHPVGTHVYRVTENIKFGVTEKGALRINVQEEGVGGKVDGLKRFVQAFHVPYARSRQKLDEEQKKSTPPNTSGLLDWLRSLGYHGNLGTLPKLASAQGRNEMQQLVRQFVGRSHRIATGAEAYCTNCKATVYSSAPKKDGVQQQFPEDHSHPGQKRYEDLACHKCGSEVTTRNSDRNFLPLVTNSHETTA